MIVYGILLITSTISFLIASQAGVDVLLPLPESHLMHERGASEAQTLLAQHPIVPTVLYPEQQYPSYELIDKYAEWGNPSRARAVYLTFSQETVLKQYLSILFVVLRVNDKELMQLALATLPFTISQKEVSDLANNAAHRCCYNSAHALIAYCAKHYPEIVDDLEKQCFIGLCYAGNLELVTAGHARLSVTPHYLNTPSTATSISGRVHRTKTGITFQRSCLSTGHSLSLSAALDTSETNVVHFLLQEGADPCAQDLKRVSPLQFMRYKLRKLRESKPPESSAELYHLWKAETERAQILFRTLKLFTLMRATSSNAQADTAINKAALTKYNHNFSDAEPETPLIIALIKNSSQDKQNQIIAATALKICPPLSMAPLIDAHGNTILHAAVEANNAYLTELIIALNPALLNKPNHSGILPIDAAYAGEKWGALGGMTGLKNEQGESIVLKRAIDVNCTGIIREALLHHRELAQCAWHTENTCYQHIIMYALARNRLEAINTITQVLQQPPVIYQAALRPAPKAHTVPSDIAMRELTNQAHFRSKAWKDHVQKQRAEIERKKKADTQTTEKPSHKAAAGPLEILKEIIWG